MQVARSNEWTPPKTSRSSLSHYRLHVLSDNGDNSSPPRVHSSGARPPEQSARLSGYPLLRRVSNPNLHPDSSKPPRQLPGPLQHLRSLLHHSTQVERRVSRRLTQHVEGTRRQENSQLAGDHAPGLLCSSSHRRSDNSPPRRIWNPNRETAFQR